jgi:hypothetical protein
VTSNRAFTRESRIEERGKWEGVENEPPGEEQFGSQTYNISLCKTISMDICGVETVGKSLKQRVPVARGRKGVCF